jgi:P27 family predicted phage terminase small subunit
MADQIVPVQVAQVVPTTNKLSLRGKVVSSPASYVAPGRPRLPKDLSADGRKVFKRLCKLLEERRTLTDADGDLLRLYCIAYQRHCRANEHLEQEGEIVVRTVTDKEGNIHEEEKQNSWLPIAERAEKAMLSILAQLGLSPAARDKIKVTRGSNGGEDLIEVKMRISSDAKA